MHENLNMHVIFNQIVYLDWYHYELTSWLEYEIVELFYLILGEELLDVELELYTRKNTKAILMSGH
jgi:hypothetical protein